MRASKTAPLLPGWEAYDLLFQNYNSWADAFWGMDILAFFV
jgi:hypothetical protein